MGRYGSQWKRLHQIGNRVQSACDGGDVTPTISGLSKKCRETAGLLSDPGSAPSLRRSLAGLKVYPGRVFGVSNPCELNSNFSPVDGGPDLIPKDQFFVAGKGRKFAKMWDLEIVCNSKFRSNCVCISSYHFPRSMSSVVYPETQQVPPVEQELFPVFAPQRFTQSASRMVSSGSLRRESGFELGVAPRYSRISVSSRPASVQFESIRNNAAVGLKVFEATATSAAFAGAEEAIDWNHQRVRLREYDSHNRSRSPPSPQSEAEPDDIFIPVKAFYISRSVDLKALAREPFAEVVTSRNNLIIRCADRPPHSPVTADNPEMACLGFVKERYMVVFQYGSVVFFNFGDLEEVESLDKVRKYCSDEFRETRKDDYGVLVRPTLPEWSEGGHDRVMLRKLDTDNIRVISSILGQSIALDHYAKKVDEMVTTFSELNRGMEQTGTFTMTRKSLFQLVAAANTTLADVILRLGLLERSDAAWKDANYAQIWEYMRDDFELDERFESLDFKLNIIQHNVRFFLEILQNRKSDTLEWIIILLITGEICVSLYDILHTAGAI
ncbi:hypothetical protein R1sor_024046 [Riccia sorocarpa]|uniref:DUF155 domain-containing protein n=1 Tax=Riccia sorocarpa TaxID=122646 RepID=A0ABD3GPC7_9MARC